MEKHRFVGKTYEEAVNKAKIELQELEENLIINVIDEKKSLFSKKKEQIIDEEIVDLKQETQEKEVQHTRRRENRII